MGFLVIQDQEFQVTLGILEHLDILEQRDLVVTAATLERVVTQATVDCLATVVIADCLVCPVTQDFLAGVDTVVTQDQEFQVTLDILDKVSQAIPATADYRVTVATRDFLETIRVLRDIPATAVDLVIPVTQVYLDILDKTES